MDLDDEVTALVRMVQERLGVEADVIASSLGDSLWRIDVVPKAENAAPATMIVTDTEVILEAGRAFRVELPQLSASQERVGEILLAVADGKLRERVANGRGRFELRLSSGEMVTGSQSGVRSASGDAEVIGYLPYGHE